MDFVIINSKKEAVTISIILAVKFSKRHDNALVKSELGNQRKTSLFHVFAKVPRRWISAKGRFNQVVQYPNCIVKFTDMAGGAA